MKDLKNTKAPYPSYNRTFIILAILLLVVSSLDYYWSYM